MGRIDQILSNFLIDTGNTHFEVSSQKEGIIFNEHLNRCINSRRNWQGDFFAASRQFNGTDKAG